MTNSNIDDLLDAKNSLDKLEEHLKNLEDFEDSPFELTAVQHHIKNTHSALKRAFNDPSDDNMLAAQTMTALFKSYAQAIGVSGMRLVNKEFQTKRADKNEELSRVDGLTQLVNKMGTLAATEDMIARSKRDGSAVAVFFIDLTKFKIINDTLGHAPGDKALQIVAEKMQEAVRDGDIVGRFGGDEFVVVMSNQDPKHYFSAEEEHLIKLFDDNIVYQDAVHGDFPIGGDIGLAIVADGETAAAAIKRADHLMYETKEARHKEMEAEEELRTEEALIPTGPE